MTPDKYNVSLGILGGSGIYKLDGLIIIEEIEVQTPFGAPSDRIIIGSLQECTVAFLPRHGREHTILPSEINYRANIYAMKSLGVKYIMSLSACGSLHEDIHPGDFVLVDQFIDRTTRRQATFFGNGIVAHVGFGTPTCPKFRALVQSVVDDDSKVHSTKLHTTGTYIAIEGPSFSTKAESLMYRQWGAHIIGMTAITEAKLCREAEIAFCTLGLVTDYDSWKEEEPHVDVAAVMEVMKKNSLVAQRITASVIQKLHASMFESDAHHALKMAICTHTEAIPKKILADLNLLIGRYVQKH